jgi:hypothetical protein
MVDFFSLVGQLVSKGTGMGAVIYPSRRTAMIAKFRSALTTIWSICVTMGTGGWSTR